MPRACWAVLRLCACVLAWQRRVTDDNVLQRSHSQDDDGPIPYEWRPEDDEVLNPLLTRPTQPQQPGAAKAAAREAEAAVASKAKQLDVIEPVVRDSFGQRGTKEDRLSGPTHALVLPSEDVLVSDSNNHRLVIFSPAGKLVRTIGSQGAGSGRFDDPRGLALDPDGEAVYVVECGNNRVQKIRISDGEPLGKTAYRLSKSASPKQLKCPESVSIGSGTIFVADTFHARIVALDFTMHFLFAFGEQGRGDGQFAFPKGLAVHDNTLLVSDTFNRRIQVFTLDGRYVRQFGTQGEGFGLLSQAQGLAAAHSWLFAADFTGACVHVFHPNGDAVQRFELPGRVTDVSEGAISSGVLYAVNNEHGQLHVLNLVMPESTKFEL